MQESRSRMVLEHEVSAAGDRKPEAGRSSCTVRACLVSEDDESLAGNIDLRQGWSSRHTEST